MCRKAKDEIQCKNTSNNGNIKILSEISFTLSVMPEYTM